MDDANQNLSFGQDEEDSRLNQPIFKSLADSVSELLYIYDLIEQRYVFINQRVEQVLGYTPEEIIAMDKNALETLVYPEDLTLVFQSQQRLKTLIGDEIFEYEYRFRHAQDEYRWLRCRDSSFARAPDGSCRQVLGTALDVTKEKHTEMALRKSEEHLSLLIESAKDYVILTTDMAGRINMWNSGAERAFGYTEEEILGKSCEILFTPEDRQLGVPAKEMRIAREHGKAADERWHIRKDGTRFYASGVLMLLRNSSVKGFAKIAHDLTHHKQATEHLQQANDALEAHVAVRTSELKQANEALHSEIAEHRAAEERIKRLLREIVHTQEGERRRIARDLHDQLGQQLNAMAINLDILKKECEEHNIPCERIETIQAIVEQLDSDVDFLTWQLRPTVLDDLGLLAALRKYVHEWSKHFGIQVEVFSTGMEKNRLSMEVETMLYRIAQEALNNVSKHSQAKNVSLLLERRPDEIWLTIEDDGSGFELEKQAVSGGDGDGLGLIGIRERTALVGGTVDIESSPGKGTNILVRIPLPPLSNKGEI
jgi:PAS domain S-box-containing protein